MRDEARRLIACGILGVLVGTMLLAVHPTQIVLIALGLFVVSFALYSLLASETGMRFGVYWGVSCRILRRHHVSYLWLG